MEQKQAKWELKEDSYLSREEFKLLRKVTEEKAIVDLAKGRTTWPKRWMMIDLVTQTGMRVMELTRVKVSHINFRKEPYIKAIGKRKKERAIFISNNLVKHLKEYIRSQGLTEDDYLLTSSRKGQYSTLTLQYHFKQACKEAGLPSYYSIHGARHSYAIFLYAKYRDLRMVQKQLGHADIQTTTVYADVLKEDISKAVNGLFNDYDE